MSTPGKEPALQAFWEQLALADQAALLLDYDGTLAPFTPHRDQARPWPSVKEVLAPILDLERCRTVFISGREAHRVALLLDLQARPEIWGVHGRERLLPDGTLQRTPLEEQTRAGLDRALAAATEGGLTHCCEEKYGALALHWRGRPAKERALIEELGGTLFPAIARAADLELKAFDGGLELRAPGVNKGEAVRTILAEMDRRAVVAFLGDDLTDEDGFRALAGRGLGVLVRRESRSTAASIQLRPPEELVAFLERWHRVLAP